MDGLLRRGWDAVRTVDVHGEGIKDPPLFASVAQLGRVFVTNDGPLHHVALDYLREGRPFRMVYRSKKDDKQYSVGQILDAFDELARAQDPFRYPIYYLKVRIPPAG